MSHRGRAIPTYSSDDGSSNVGLSDDEHLQKQNTFSYSKYETQKIIDQFGGPADYDAIDEVDLSDAFDPTILDKTKRIVIPIFVSVAVAAIIMMITGFVTDFVGGIIAILSIVTMTWVGSIMGMIGTYLWGSVDEVIDFFKKQNEKFENNVDELKTVRLNLRDETEKLFFGVGKLNRISKDLDQHLKEFDNLRKELGKICESNQDLNYLLDDINKQYDDLVNVIGNNERAQLLSIYYEVSTKDREEGLSAKEYERFLGRLNQSTKDFFIAEGSFKQLAGDDGIMDLQEFESVLDIVIKKQEEQFLQTQFI